MSNLSDAEIARIKERVRELGAHEYDIDEAPPPNASKVLAILGAMARLGVLVRQGAPDIDALSYAMGVVELEDQEDQHRDYDVAVHVTRSLTLLMHADVLARTFGLKPVTPAGLETI